MLRREGANRAQVILERVREVPHGQETHPADGIARGGKLPANAQPVPDMV